MGWALDGWGWGWGWRVSSCRFTWFGRVGGVILGGFLEVKTGLEEEQTEKQV